MIRIIKQDINQFIAKMLNQGTTESDIPIILYDYRINGIDTMEKAESAYSDYIKSKGETL